MGVGRLTCAIARSKKVSVSELRKIAGVSYLGKITKIGCGRARNYDKCAPTSAGILAYAICYSKKVALSESHEITQVAYLCQITIIGSGRTHKL